MTEDEFLERIAPCPSWTTHVPKSKRPTRRCWKCDIRSSEDTCFCCKQAMT